MESPEEVKPSNLDMGTFFRDYWRKKPLHLPGGAEGFLGRGWSIADFVRTLNEARSAGYPVQDRDGDVTFIEKVSEFDADLAVRAKEFAAQFGTPETWFDTIRTRAPDGIGSHFDHSDNFVLQQEGTKEWSLAPSSIIDRRERARRMMNVPGVGAHELPPAGSLHFTLEPGDLLYIPLLWVHSGVSRGPSLSLSLVCPAVSLYAAVVPLVSQIARSRLLGHQAIPAFHASMSDQELRDAIGVLHTATQSLLERLSGEELRDAVLAAQGEQLIGATRQQQG